MPAYQDTKIDLCRHEFNVWLQNYIGIAGSVINKAPSSVAHPVCRTQVRIAQISCSLRKRFEDALLIKKDGNTCGILVFALKGFDDLSCMSCG
jgi:hypothetical protein